VPGVCGYAAAKHAVVGMMRTAAAEYGPKGLRINCINPGGTGELLQLPRKGGCQIAAVQLDLSPWIVLSPLTVAPPDRAHCCCC
jgi:NAD(P)-dependent dehydrogenase (short-subunit alcohol dehydrogenase family)